MDEDKKPKAKTKFKIDLFQTARVHTEQFVEEFDTPEEAEAYARDLCKDKGIEPDFEIEPVPEPEVSVAEDVQPETENSPEGSDEKTTQENGLPVN